VLSAVLGPLAALPALADPTPIPPLASTIPLPGGPVGAPPVAAAAFARGAPFPPPILPAPGVPLTPVQRALVDARDALLRAAVVDPSRAQSAAFLYATARERAERGDVAGALAAASAARASANAVPSGPTPLAPATSV
jgi:hypothetical protein